MLGNSAFLSSADFFKKIGMANSLDPGQVRHFIGSDFGKDYQREKSYSKADNEIILV